MKARKIKLSAEEERDIREIEAVELLAEARELLREFTQWFVPAGRRSKAILDAARAFLEKTE